MEKTPWSQKVCTLKYGLLNQPTTVHIVTERFDSCLEMDRDLKDLGLFIKLYLYPCELRPSTSISNSTWNLIKLVTSWKKLHFLSCSIVLYENKQQLYVLLLVLHSNFNNKDFLNEWLGCRTNFARTLDPYDTVPLINWSYYNVNL